MLQIVIILFGVAIVIAGANGLRKGELMLSKNKPVHGTPAVVGNVFTVLIGLGAIGFALFGIGT